MHAVSFAAKRLHLATNTFGQRVLDGAKVRGMTPARFDLLCLLRQPGIELQKRFRHDKKSKLPWPGANEAFLRQCVIVRKLGLHASTVSKMVKRLCEMGWVTVSRDYPDRRFKVVVATPLGLRRIWEAMRRVFRGRLLLKPYEMVHRQLRPTHHVLEALDDTFQLLDALADWFGDRAEFFYDFGSRDRILDGPLPTRAWRPWRRRRRPPTRASVRLSARSRMDEKSSAP